MMMMMMMMMMMIVGRGEEGDVSLSGNMEGWGGNESR